jgi:hypothetical protein
MPARLKLSEQRALLGALPKSRIKALEKHCLKCQMKGQGIKEILKSASQILGPIAKELGPTVMKELIIPMLKKQMGMGLSLPGGALKLAGQGKKKIKK